MRQAPAAVGCAVTLVGLRLRPLITLDTDTVEVAVRPDELVTRFRSQWAQGPEVLVAGDDSLVRRFSGRAGAFRYRTVELVTFSSSEITFEHLRGPFATCNERFVLTPTAAGTRLTHSGTLRLRGGLFTWSTLGIPVKRAFEAHVREHFDRLRDELATADRSDPAPDASSA